jgi:hypothetical protein
VKIRRFFLLAPLIMGFGSGLRAQEEQLTLEPPLSQAFPVIIQPGGARVPYPILVNDHTILKPDAVLRFVFIDPNAGLHRGNGGGGGFGLDDDSGGPVAHSHIGPAGTLEQDPGKKVDGGAGAWGSNGGDPDAGMFDDNNKKDDAKTKKSELQTEVWLQKDLFSEAFDHATETGTTLVYLTPAQKRPTTAVLDLPEGMLLAEVGGHVRVLGVSPQSRAYVGGVRAGDEIRSLGGSDSLATLSDFVRAFTATKRQARLSGNPTYPMEIWRPGEGQLLPIQVAAPPSIPSFLRTADRPCAFG